MDPANPPAVGTTLTPSYLELVDQDDDNDIGEAGGDLVNGIDVTASWPGDTVTINTPSGDITYVGITFYTSDGARYFTPTDNQVLQEGTFVTSDFVNTQQPLEVGDLGPSCFTPGTQITVPHGSRAVETLCVGDVVQTLDDGAQPIRMILRNQFRAQGDFAPIRFEKGAIGNPVPLTVSPQHRMLITGWQAQLYCGQDEVLVAAKHLVNGRDITRVEGGMADYIHLVFDCHQIVFGGGVPSESYFPGGSEVPSDPATLRELRAIFPMLETISEHEIPMARPVMVRREAVLLAA